MQGSKILLVLFEIGDLCYALEARSIGRIVSLQDMTHNQQGAHHPAVIGFLRSDSSSDRKYQTGTLVSVIDLSLMLLKKPLSYQLGTRIMLVHDQQGQPWGLMANGVIEMIEVSPRDWEPVSPESPSPAPKSSRSPYIQQTLLHHQRVIHGLSINRLLKNVNVCTY